MTGKERMEKAMHLQVPDRVPVMCQLALGHYFLYAKGAPHRIWFTSEGFVEALIEMRSRYRFDGMLANLWGMPEDLLDHVTSLTVNEEGSEVLLWENGEYSVLPPDDNAQHFNADGSALDRADFAALALDELDSINAINGYFWNIYHRPNLPEVYDEFKPGEIPDCFTKPLELLTAQAGSEYSIHGEIYSPFTHFIELFGYEQALMALLTDEHKAHAVLGFLTEAVLRQAKAICNLEVDALLISSAFAGGPFLSRDLYRSFVLPCEQQIAQAVKSWGNVVYTHTCGKIGDRLDLMIETGTMGIDTFDPPPLGNADLKTAVAEIDGRVFIKGNMNPVGLLEFTSREEVLSHAADRIGIGGPGGGYILSTACSVAPKTEPWKLELFTPLAEKIGKF